jgi:hypothetical protein
MGVRRSKNGAGTKIRTRDLLITNQLLYQLSYTGMYLGVGAYSKPCGAVSEYPLLTSL